MNYLTGGVNSPIPIPESYPSDIVSGQGPFVFNSDGKKYIDMWMGYGALIFGHADPDLVKEIGERAKDGWFYSYQTKIEKDFSEIIHKLIPSAESVRFATSGSDAVAYAIRAARAYTSRNSVLSIIGGYHGVHESMIPSEGTMYLSAPDLIHFNDIEEAKRALGTKKYACMVLEQIMANSGCTPPDDGYLLELRKLCDETGTVLIFDEVVTGFRIGLGGAQKRFGVTPDLSTFSKAIAGGLPLSVVCGKKTIMEGFIPTGKVFFAGTFNAHPLSIALAMKVVDKLKDGSVHSKSAALGDRLRSFIARVIEENNLNASVQGIDSMLTIAFGCKSFKSGIKNENYDEKAYSVFIKKMADQNILFPPLPTETVFLSPVHEEVIGEIESALKKSLSEMKGVISQ